MLFTCFSYGQKNKNLNKGEVPINIEEMNNASNNKNNSSTLRDLFLKVEGTYQIQTSDSKYKVLLTNDIYELVQNRRLINKDLYLLLDSKSTLYLPSSNKLKSVNFKKLKSSIYKTK